MRRDCHPLLRGGRRCNKYTPHILSSAEMESLSSICEALLPPLQLDSTKSKAVQHFWKASGSQFSIPHEVGHIVAMWNSLSE